MELKSTKNKHTYTCWEHDLKEKSLQNVALTNLPVTQLSLLWNGCLKSSTCIGTISFIGRVQGVYTYVDGFTCFIIQHLSISPLHLC